MQIAKSGVLIKKAAEQSQTNSLKATSSSAEESQGNKIVDCVVMAVATAPVIGLG